MKKIKILIVDDVEAQRNVAQAALVQGASDRNKSHLNAIQDLFEIQRFAIVGAAIDALKTFAPDMALVDVGFMEISENQVREAGYVPEKEITHTRGLDLIVALKAQHPGCQPILFTGHGGNIDIYQILKAQGYWRAENFVRLAGKDVDLLEMHDITHRFLQQWLNQQTKDVDIADLRQKLAKYQSDQLPQLLDIMVHVGQARWLVRHLFAHLVYFESTTLFYKDLYQNLQNLVNPPQEEDEPETPTETMVSNWPAPKFNGQWQAPFVQDALAIWAKPEHDATRQEINQRAYNYLLYAIRAHRNGTHFAPLDDFNPLGQFNIGNQVQVYGDPGWTALFHNALMMRRVLLGLSELAQQHPKIFVNRPGQINPIEQPFSVFFPFCRIIYTPELEPENLRRIVSEVLGLSKQRFYGAKTHWERLNVYGWAMQEEWVFLQALQRLPDSL